MKNLYLILLFFILLSVQIFGSSSYVWENKLNTNPIQFTGIDNFDSLNIIAVGNLYGALNRILKSTDGGMTWDSIYIETFDTIRAFKKIHAVSYPTKKFCIVTCDSGAFLKTTDGGINWKKTRTEYVGYRRDFINVSMLDEHHGVMSTYFDVIISHDGFETWDSLKLPGKFYTYSIQIISPYTVYCLVLEIPKQDNRFFRTRDGGKTWEEFPYPDPHPEFIHTNSMKFVDSLFGYSVGGDRTGNGDTRYDKIFRTTNGGETWELVLDTLLKPRFGLTNLDILDRDNAIFVGQFGKIYWTHDGGNTFIYDSSAAVVDHIPATIYTAILGENTALTVDLLGRIFRSSLATDVKETPGIVDYDLLVHPNPATDYIEISTSAVMLNEVKHPVIKIYDVLGVCVLSHGDSRFRGNDRQVSDEGLIRIDVSGFAAGVYFVRVGDKVLKFVKI